MSESVLTKIEGTVKYKKVDGTLTLTNDTFLWKAKEGKQFQCNYSEIKVQRISPDTSSKVQLQVVLHTDASHNFQFVHSGGRAQQQQERNAVKDLLAQLIPKHREKANKELEEKNKLFKEFPDLYQLYKDLVVTGIITAEEFWQNQKRHTNGNSSEKQNVGIASGLLAELRPDMHGCNELRFNLTADSIDAIFKMYPAVKKRYVEIVPHEMSEKEFWTEFFQSQHFHRDRIQKNTDKDVFGELAKKDESEQLKTAAPQFSDPLIDFSPTCPVLQEGYGLVPKVNDQKASAAGTLIKHFNHQSFMVLKGATLREEVDEVQRKKRKVREAITMNELEEQHKSEGAILKIVETTDKFSHSHVAVQNGYQNGNSHHNIDTFKRKIADWTPRLDQVLPADAARLAIAEIAPGGKFCSNKIANSSLNVPSHLNVELRKNYLAMAELLRHFWSCFPVKTPQLEDKVKRMADSLKKFHSTKLANFTCSLPATHAHLGDHLNETINVALKKFSAWESRRQKKS